MMTNDVYLSLGANVEPEANLKRALELLAELTRLVAVSSAWQTKPLGMPDQPDFLNAAAVVKTDMGPARLKREVLGRIERRLGRVREGNKSGPRPIDIDIMFFNREILRIGSRPIPHPEVLERAFVAVPLAEVAPDYRHPETGQTLREIAQGFRIDDTEMRLRPDVSRTLGNLRGLSQLNRPRRKTWSSPRGGRIVGQPPVLTVKTGANSRRHQKGVTVNHLNLESLHETFEISPNGNSGNDPARKQAIEAAVEQTLVSIGEDPDREGLRQTPDRVARMYDELTAGYHVDPVKLINDALFEVDYNEMVIVKDVDFYSLCEHHLLPFFGRAHIAYIPKGKVVGLSKIPRIVEMFARRLQVQERMTQQINDFIVEVLDPHGVAVVVEGAHMCSMMRGVKKANATMITSAVSGCFKSDPKTRAEFMEHIGRRRFDE
jgi:GTP cyclohydrolase IA